MKHKLSKITLVFAILLMAGFGLTACEDKASDTQPAQNTEQKAAPASEPPKEGANP